MVRKVRKPQKTTPPYMEIDTRTILNLGTPLIRSFNQTIRALRLRVWRNKSKKRWWCYRRLKRRIETIYEEVWRNLLSPMRLSRSRVQKSLYSLKNTVRSLNEWQKNKRYPKKSRHPRTMMGKWPTKRRMTDLLQIPLSSLAIPLNVRAISLRMCEASLLSVGEVQNPV